MMRRYTARSFSFNRYLASSRGAYNHIYVPQRYFFLSSRLNVAASSRTLEKLREKEAEDYNKEQDQMDTPLKRQDDKSRANMPKREESKKDKDPTKKDPITHVSGFSSDPLEPHDMPEAEPPFFGGGGAMEKESGLGEEPYSSVTEQPMMGKTEAQKMAQETQNYNEQRMKGRAEEKKDENKAKAQEAMNKGKAAEKSYNSSNFSGYSAEKTEELKAKAKDAVGRTGEKAGQKMGKAAESVGNAAERAGKATKKAGREAEKTNREDVKEKAEDMYGKAADTVSSVADKAKEVGGKVAEKAKGTWEKVKEGVVGKPSEDANKM